MLQDASATPRSNTARCSHCTTCSIFLGPGRGISLACCPGSGLTQRWVMLVHFNGGTRTAEKTGASHCAGTFCANWRLHEPC